MRLTSTVITAAGNSLNVFIPSGFGLPKSLIPIGSAPLLVQAIKAYSHSLENTTVAINIEEDKEFGIAGELHNYLPGVNICKVQDKVAGALISALIAVKDCDPEGPLVIASGDSVFTGDIGAALEDFQVRELSAAALVFPSNNPRWSYLRLNGDGDVIEVAEKKVVGKYATTGFFYFQSVRLFVEAATWVLVNNVNYQGRFYVSAAMNYLISRGGKLGYHLAAPEAFRSYALPHDFVVESD